MTISVIGDCGAGKTTVMCLLYQAATRYQQQHPEDFRILYEPRSQNENATMHTDMTKFKEFPSKTPWMQERIEDREPYLRAMIGFRRGILGELYANLNDDKVYHGFVHVILEVYDFPGEEIIHYIRDEFRLTENLKHIFLSNPLIFVIGAQWFTGTEQDDLDAAYQDEYTSTFLSGLLECRVEENYQGENNIFIIFTQIDQMGDGRRKLDEESNNYVETRDVIGWYNQTFKLDGKIMQDDGVLDELLRINDLPEDIKPVAHNAPREGILRQRVKKRDLMGITLLNEFLTNSTNPTEGGVLAGHGYNKKFFYSWVGVEDERGEISDENNETQNKRLRVIRESGQGPINDFPLNEYFLLIESIKEILKQDRNVAASSETVKKFYGD